MLTKKEEKIVNNKYDTWNNCQRQHFAIYGSKLSQS